MEIMIDIETLSTSPIASIATIGAIRFKRDTPIPKLSDIKEEDKFYTKVDKNSCDKLSLHVDENTIKWWSNQPEESIKEIFGKENRISIEEALSKLTIFTKDSTIIWANSPNFDTVILENAYKKSNMIPPWKFWNLRDCRTVYDLGKVSLREMNKEEKTTTSHNALKDCHDQILCLQLALKKMGIYKYTDIETKLE